MNADFISIADACKFLSISRPTLDKYREDYQLKEIKNKGRVFFSKLEIIEKIIYPNQFFETKKYFLTAIDNESLSRLFVSSDILDIRGDIALDAFGVISLLCKLKDLIRNENKNIYILVSDSPFCRYLKKLGFFNELTKSNPEKVFIKSELIADDQSALKGSIILPLHLLGYRGAEKKIIDELYDALMSQGFSEELSSFLGWVIGELSDNCHTHSKGGPCYLMIESNQSKEIHSKFLNFVIGDVGIGIPYSLKTNKKYYELSDEQAFISAFLSNVSSWPDEHKRGKGLNDILGIAIGNETWIRCESNGLALLANFFSKKKNIRFIDNATDARGTRIALTLIDNTFTDITRVEVNETINNLLRKL